MTSENGRYHFADHDSLEDESFPPLPPPHSPGQGGQEEGDLFANGNEEGEVSKLAEVPAAKRKGVKRPQPKLDAQRLISERGLPALRTLLDDVHFKGKGHEAENLRLLMQKMENWAHRLYPKLQFEDFIDKVEKLGNKKEVQTCLKRIRQDMPLTEDFIIRNVEEEAAPEMQVFEDPDPFVGVSFPNDTRPVHSTPAPVPATSSLTEDQRRRMELNKQRALERRLARQKQQTDLSDSQTDTPTSVPSANVLGSSNDEDEKVDDFDLEPTTTTSSSTQQPDNLVHKESSLCQEEKETNPEHGPSNECQDGD